MKDSKNKTQQQLLRQIFFKSIVTQLFWVISVILAFFIVGRIVGIVLGDMSAVHEKGSNLQTETYPKK